jgi:RNA 2',3'-cyclic 3'-phosphodiesterase
VRLFFALWPDTDIARQLENIAAELKLANPSRLVSPKNYHLTLAFVGEVEPSRLAVLQRIGGNQRSVRCTVAFDELEYWRKAQVVVAAAAEPPPALLDLSAQLHAQLHEALALAPTRLRAHATLARKVTQAPVLQAMSPLQWRATSFSLVRSETSGAESAYTVLDTWPLLDET